MENDPNENNTTNTNDTDEGMDRDINTPTEEAEETLTDAEIDEITGKETSDDKGASKLVESEDEDPNKNLPPDSEYEYVVGKDGKLVKVKKQKAVDKKKANVKKTNDKDEEAAAEAQQEEDERAEEDRKRADDAAKKDEEHREEDAEKQDLLNRENDENQKRQDQEIRARQESDTAEQNTGSERTEEPEKDDSEDYRNRNIADQRAKNFEADTDREIAKDDEKQTEETPADTSVKEETGNGRKESSETHAEDYGDQEEVPEDISDNGNRTEEPENGAPVEDVGNGSEYPADEGRDDYSTPEEPDRGEDKSGEAPAEQEEIPEAENIPSEELEEQEETPAHDEEESTAPSENEVPDESRSDERTDESPRETASDEVETTEEEKTETPESEEPVEDRPHEETPRETVSDEHGAGYPSEDNVPENNRDDESGREQSENRGEENAPNDAENEHEDSGEEPVNNRSEEIPDNHDDNIDAGEGHEDEGGGEQPGYGSDENRETYEHGEQETYEDARDKDRRPSETPENDTRHTEEDYGSGNEPEDEKEHNRNISDERAEVFESGGSDETAQEEDEKPHNGFKDIPVPDSEKQEETKDTSRNDDSGHTEYGEENGRSDAPSYPDNREEDRKEQGEDTSYREDKGETRDTEDTSEKPREEEKDAGRRTDNPSNDGRVDDSLSDENRDDSQKQGVNRDAGIPRDQTDELPKEGEFGGQDEPITITPEEDRVERINVAIGAVVVPLTLTDDNFYQFSGDAASAEAQAVKEHPEIIEAINRAARESNSAEDLDSRMEAVAESFQNTEDSHNAPITIQTEHVNNNSVTLTIGNTEIPLTRGDDGNYYFDGDRNSEAGRKLAQHEDVLDAVNEAARESKSREDFKSAVNNLNEDYGGKRSDTESETKAKTHSEDADSHKESEQAEEKTSERASDNGGGGNNGGNDGGGGNNGGNDGGGGNNNDNPAGGTDKTADAAGAEKEDEKPENPFAHIGKVTTEEISGSSHDYAAFTRVQEMAKKTIENNGGERTESFSKGLAKYVQSDDFVENKKNSMSFRGIRATANDSDSVQNVTLLTALDFKDPEKRLKRLNALKGMVANGNLELNEDEMAVLKAAGETTDIKVTKDRRADRTLGAFSYVGHGAINTVKQYMREGTPDESYAVNAQNLKSGAKIAGRMLGFRMQQLGVTGAMGTGTYFASQIAKESDASQRLMKLCKNDREATEILKGFVNNNNSIDFSKISNKATFKKIKKIEKLYKESGSAVAARFIMLRYLHPKTAADDVLGLYKTKNGKFVTENGRKVLTRQGRQLKKYVTNPVKFFDISSPKLTVLGVRKILMKSKNKNVVEAVTTLNSKKINDLLKHSKEYGLTSDEVNLLTHLNRAAEKKASAKILGAKAGALIGGISMFALQNDQDSAAAVSTVSRIAGVGTTTFRLGVAGGSVALAAGRFVWNSRLGRFVRLQNGKALNAIKNTKTGKAVTNAVKTAKRRKVEAHNHAIASAKNLRHVLANSTPAHVIRNSAHKAANSTVGRAARKFGSGVRRGVTAVGGAVGRVANVVFAPIRAINKAFSAVEETLHRLKVKLLALLAIILIVLLILMMIGFALLSAGSAAGGVISQTNAQVEETEMTGIIGYLNGLDKDRVATARDIGTSTPINAEVYYGKTLKRYGYTKSDQSNGQNIKINDKSSIGYNIFYVTKDGQAISTDATNSKSIIAVAIAMFSNNYTAEDETAMYDLLDDLYAKMAPTGTPQEYQGEVDWTNVKTQSSIYNGEGASLNIDGSSIFYKESDIITNKYQQDTSNYYNDAYNDTYTIYCNDNSSYTTPTEVLASGAALYLKTDDGYTKVTSASDFPAHTTQGCETKVDTDAYNAAISDWQDDEPDAPNRSNYSSDEDYENDMGTWRTRHQEWSNSKPDENDYLIHYCPGHTYTVDYGHKTIDIYLPLLTVSDMEEMTVDEILPSDWESKSYASYIQEFVNQGGFAAETYCEMAENIENETYDEFYTTIEEFGNDATAFIGVSTVDPENTQAVEDAVEAYRDEYGDVAGTRAALVAFALTMEDQIPYFYGGSIYLKSKNFAENNFCSWASPSDDKYYYDYNYDHELDFQGKHYDHRILKGLDCSSFVNFCLWNVTGTKNLIITTGNWNCDATEFYDSSKLKPGDIGMEHSRNSSTQGGGNHIGIYVGRDSNGKAVWVHCCGKYGVVKGNVDGFRVYYRLNFLD